MYVISDPAGNVTSIELAPKSLPAVKVGGNNRDGEKLPFTYFHNVTGLHYSLGCNNNLTINDEYTCHEVFISVLGR